MLCCRSPAANLMRLQNRRRILLELESREELTPEEIANRCIEEREDDREVPCSVDIMHRVADSATYTDNVKGAVIVEVAVILKQIGQLRVFLKSEPRLISSVIKALVEHPKMDAKLRMLICVPIIRMLFTVHSQHLHDLKDVAASNVSIGQLLGQFIRHDLPLAYFGIAKNGFTETARMLEFYQAVYGRDKLQRVIQSFFREELTLSPECFYFLWMNHYISVENEETLKWIKNVRSNFEKDTAEAVVMDVVLNKKTTCVMTTFSIGDGANSGIANAVVNIILYTSLSKVDDVITRVVSELTKAHVYLILSSEISFQCKLAVITKLDRALVPILEYETLAKKKSRHDSHDMIAALRCLVDVYCTPLLENVPNPSFLRPDKNIHAPDRGTVERFCMIARDVTYLRQIAMMFPDMIAHVSSSESDEDAVVDISDVWNCFNFSVSSSWAAVIYSLRAFLVRPPEDTVGIEGCVHYLYNRFCIPWNQMKKFAFAIVLLSGDLSPIAVGSVIHIFGKTDIYIALILATTKFYEMMNKEVIRTVILHAKRENYITDDVVDRYNDLDNDNDNDRTSNAEVIRSELLSFIYADLRRMWTM